MKIFDGVQVNPATLSPTWQGVLGVAMLFANSFIEADKIRTQRVAREHAQRQEPTTLSDVMEQSGLKIPHLHDALTAFMGGTEEAKDAATLIVNTPDPVKLLRDFAKQYTPACAANGPIVTPPPTAAPARPMPASPAPSAASSKGAATASSPRPKPAAFRPEFTREGLEAAERAKAAAPRPKPAAFRPEFTREGLAAAAGARAAATAAPPTNPSAPTPPAPAQSLVDALAERLEVLTQKMDAHHAELDSRIRCAEAELAALCEELQDLRVSSDRPILFVVPSIDEVKPPPIDQAPPLDESTSPPVVDEAPPLDEATSPPVDVVPPIVEATSPPIDEAKSPPIAASPSAENVATDEPSSVDGADGGLADGVKGAPATSEAQMTADVNPNDDAPVTPAPLAADASPPLPSGTSDADVARAFSMLGKFADQAEAHYASEAERVRALERKVSHMRGLLERSRGSAASRG